MPLFEEMATCKMIYALQNSMKCWQMNGSPTPRIYGPPKKFSHSGFVENATFLKLDWIL